MGMIPCGRCTALIADDAEACPRCGAPQYAAVARRRRRAWGAYKSFMLRWGGMVLASAFILACFTNTSPAVILGCSLLWLALGSAWFWVRGRPD